MIEGTTYQHLSGVKAVAWDLDGTLIDSFSLYCEIVAELSEARGRQMPDPNWLQRHYHGTLDGSLKVALELESEAEIASAIKDFIKLQSVHYEEVDHHFFKDACELVERTSQAEITQMVVTNREHRERFNASPHSIIGRWALSHCIHEVRTADDIAVEHRKPSPKSIEDLIQKHSIEGSELVVVGDQFVDAQLALNLGGRAVLVDRVGGIPHLDELEEPIKSGKVVITDSLSKVQINPS